MQEALTGLAIALIVMVGGLIPYLGPAAKAALVAFTEKKHMAAITGAAETLAVRAAKASATTIDRSLDAQITKLRDRLPDAMTALDPTNEALRDVLVKAAATVAAKAVQP